MGGRSDRHHAARRSSQPTAPLLRAVLERCHGSERHVLLFDGLDAMAGRWGSDAAARFFARCCPQLLDLGATAYWFMPATDEYAALRRTVEEITQCVFRVDQERLRIAKADGRPPGVEGSVFRCSEEDGLLVLTPAPIVARIGAALSLRAASCRCCSEPVDPCSEPPRRSSSTRLRSSAGATCVGEAALFWILRDGRRDA